MERILVPVDFSAHMDISCNYAVEIANVTGAEIILFHSFFEQIYFSDGGFATGFESGIMLTDEIVLDFYKQKEKQLEALADKIKSSANTQSERAPNIIRIIETGDPQIQILNVIDKLGPDLVIMGSAGLGKKGFLAGSVCKRIMDHSEIPVMAIPEIDTVKGFQNILYVTDMEQNDTLALNKISHMFEVFSCQVHCLHLNVGNKDKESEKQMIHLSQKEELKNDASRYKFHVISCEDPKVSLMDYIAVNDIQLIAFIPHKRNFFNIFSHQDLTKGDLFLTGLPILGIM
jgi:nucleotide-binding universal stress UspA family protein